MLLTPAHQFPLGVALDPVRRQQIVQWARDTGAVVIEDDFDGEFRYDRHPVGALQALAPEHVVYAGTASKSLIPGLRLSWLVLPDRLLADLVEAKRATGLLSSCLDQLALAEFIGSGGYDHQIRRSRLSYRRRRDALLAVLARRAPQVTVTGIAAGLHALVRLPADPSASAAEVEAAVVAEAARRGLALQGLSSFAARRADPAAGSRSAALHRAVPSPSAALHRTVASPSGHVDPAAAEPLAAVRPAAESPSGEASPAAGSVFAGASPAAESPSGEAGPAGMSLPGPALVIGYATPPDHAYTAALSRLAASLSPG